LKELEQWLRGLEWNMKNAVRLTEKDRVDFKVVEGRFDEWYKKLQAGQQASVDALIKTNMRALKIFGPNAKITEVNQSI
jgi:hypothetical protein